MKRDIFERVDAVRVGVLGDFCVDLYWHADMKLSRLSRETPSYPLPIYDEIISPGAAGNVAANLAALKPGAVAVCGVIGDDWRGEMLRTQLRSKGIDTEGLIAVPGRFTNAYCKPMLHGISDVVYENPRLDFENRALPDRESEAAVIAWLESHRSKLDILCVCDQFENGTVTPAVRTWLSDAARCGLNVICDSRLNAHLFANMIVKPNEVECLAAVGMANPAPTVTEVIAAAKQLSRQHDLSVLVTMGSNGSTFVENGETVCMIPAVRAEPPLDTCGAGDTFLSAFSLLYAAGHTIRTCMTAAACASAVTVKKLCTTGTATREEIFQTAQEKGGLLA